MARKSEKGDLAAKRRRNKVARELNEKRMGEFRPRMEPNKRTKISLNDLDKLVDEDESE